MNYMYPYNRHIMGLLYSQVSNLIGPLGVLKIEDPEICFALLACGSEDMKCNPSVHPSACTCTSHVLMF